MDVVVVVVACWLNYVLFFFLTEKVLFHRYTDKLQYRIYLVNNRTASSTLTAIEIGCHKQSHTLHFAAVSFIQSSFYTATWSICQSLCDCLTAIGSLTRCLESLLPLLLWQPPVLDAAFLSFRITAFTNTRQSPPPLLFLVPHQHFSFLDSQYIRRITMTSRLRSLLPCARLHY